MLTANSLRKSPENAPLASPELLAAIAGHSDAVSIDEASYDALCNPISKERAEGTGAAEVEALQALAEMPCRSHADVQAKLDYVLNTVVGVRSPIIECLSDESYGGAELMEQFVRSLAVLPNGRKRP